MPFSYTYTFMGDRRLGITSGAVWICEVEQLSRVGKVKLGWGGGDLTLSPSGKTHWICSPIFYPVGFAGTVGGVGSNRIGASCDSLVDAQGKYI